MDEIKNTASAETEVSAEARKKFSLKKEILGLLCLLLALGLFCGVSSAVVTPKRHDYGAVWGMYEKEPENSLDVLFLGSSLSYCDVAPAVLYEEMGLTSFVLAGPEQTFPVTYYYLQEAVKTQSPDVIFIEATPIYFARSNRSVKVNLTYLPWGLNRLIPTFTERLTEGADTEEATALMEREARNGLLFPLYAYHDRWDELNRRDIKEGLLGYDTDPLGGYTFLDQATPIAECGLRDLPKDEENYLRNLEYAEKMVKFCRERDMLIVFFLSPTAQQIDWPRKARLMEDLKSIGSSLVDFNDGAAFELQGYDFETDFYDPRHLNYRGAEKFCKYLADRFPAWGIHPAGGEDLALWQSRVEEFHERRDAADAAPLRLNQAEIDKINNENQNGND